MFKLKSTKNYTDKHGTTSADFKLAVDKVVLDKKNKIATVYPTIYENQTARDNKNVPVEHNFGNKIDFRGDKYDEFFDDAILSSNNKDAFEQSYLALADMEDDEQNKILADWESDE